MTIEEAVALQPIWVQWWLIALTLATTALPIMLMFHRKTRLSGIVVLLTSFVGGYGVQILFDNLGYVRLLALPHVIFWTPAFVYLVIVLRRPRITKWVRYAGFILAAFLATSLIFDWWSVLLHVLGHTDAVNLGLDAVS